MIIRGGVKVVAVVNFKCASLVAPTPLDNIILGADVDCDATADDDGFEVKVAQPLALVIS